MFMYVCMAVCLKLSCVSVRLAVCFQNLCSSRHRAVHPEAAGGRAVAPGRSGRVPYAVWSLYICLQAALQHLPGVTGPPTLRPAPGDRCGLEESA